jgi:hypothetical protein
MKKRMVLIDESPSERELLGLRAGEREVENEQPGAESREQDLGRRQSFEQCWR